MAAGDRDILEIVPGLANAACPVPEVLTGGQPTEEHLKTFVEHGYRTVLDLRAPDEARPYDEPEAVRRLGLEYVSLPVTPDTLTDDTFARFRSLMRDQGVGEPGGSVADSLLHPGRGTYAGTGVGGGGGGGAQESRAGGDGHGLRGAQPRLTSMEPAWRR
jgi:hypothetical protein